MTKQVDLRRYERLVAAAGQTERTLAERATAAMTVCRWETEGHPTARAPWSQELLAMMALERLPAEMRAYGTKVIERILAGHSQAVAKHFLDELREAEEKRERPAVIMPIEWTPRVIEGGKGVIPEGGKGVISAFDDQIPPHDGEGFEGEEEEEGDGGEGERNEKGDDVEYVPEEKTVEDEDYAEMSSEPAEPAESEDSLQAGDTQDGITLTEEQVIGLRRILRAVADREREVRLSGSAGVGKTTLMRTITRELSERGVPFVLLGPTNQAARRLAKLTGHEAGTVHQLIYPRPEETPSGDLIFPAPRIPTNDVGEPVVDPGGVFIVDETSMVGRKLADDLRSLIYGTILWLGDAAQLPPVGEPPGVKLSEAEVILKQVHRQAASSPVLGMATQIRQTEWDDWGRPTLYQLTEKYKVHYRRGATGQVAADLLAMHRNGRPDAVCLTWMNATRHQINKRYRGLCGATAPLHVGERLVMCANHYHLGLLNGDVVRVARVEWTPLPNWLGGCIGAQLGTIWLEGRKDPIFVTDTLLSAERRVWSQAISVARSLIDTIYKEGSANHLAAVRTLTNLVMADYAYALTAHRFQGSQASTVLVAWTQDWLWNPYRNRPEGVDAIREAKKRFEDVRCWLYTAVTRTSDYLQITNIPKEVDNGSL